MTKIYGPYYRKDGRQHVVIKHDDGRMQTKSYPKHLLEQKLGRELVGDETCDHVDEDLTNDDPNNLQVLSRVENSEKAQLGREAETYSFICPVCKNPTTKLMKDVKHCWNQGRTGPVCSKECAGLVSKNITRHETTYSVDSHSGQVVVEFRSWDIP